MRRAIPTELMRIKGTGYFERRRIRREEISQRLGEFLIFGPGEEIVSQVRSLVSCGASKVVLYPGFQDMEDLIRQMNMTSDRIE